MKQYSSLAGDQNQAEMTTKLPGHMGPLAGSVDGQSCWVGPLLGGHASKKVICKI